MSLSRNAIIFTPNPTSSPASSFTHIEDIFPYWLAVMALFFTVLLAASALSYAVYRLYLGLSDLIAQSFSCSKIGGFHVSGGRESAQVLVQPSTIETDMASKLDVNSYGSLQKCDEEMDDFPNIFYGNKNGSDDFDSYSDIDPYAELAELRSTEPSNFSGSSSYSTFKAISNIIEGSKLSNSQRDCSGNLSDNTEMLDPAEIYLCQAEQRQKELQLYIELQCRTQRGGEKARPRKSEIRDAPSVRYDTNLSSDIKIRSMRRLPDHMDIQSQRADIYCEQLDFFIRHQPGFFYAHPETTVSDKQYPRYWCNIGKLFQVFRKPEDLYEEYNNILESHSDRFIVNEDSFALMECTPRLKGVNMNGVSPEQMLYGKYKCTVHDKIGCGYEWSSLESRQNSWECCIRCGEKVYPYELRLTTDSPTVDLPLGQYAFDDRIQEQKLEVSIYHFDPQSVLGNSSQANSSEIQVGRSEGLWDKWDDMTQRREVIPPSTFDFDEKLCIICLSARKSIIILPCFHLVFCEDCGFSSNTRELALGLCPICRGTIDDLRKIYT